MAFLRWPVIGCLTASYQIHSELVFQTELKLSDLIKDFGVIQLTDATQQTLNETHETSAYEY